MAENERVAEAAPENGGFAAQDRQGLVSVLHTERRMKVFGVTENELRTITAINVAVTVLFSLGTGAFAFGIDLHKDLLLTEKIPDKALILRFFESVSFIIGGVFYIIGIIGWFIRGGFIRTLKKESKI